MVENRCFNVSYGLLWFVLVEPEGVLYILIICIMQKICTVLCIIRSSFYA